MGPGFRSTDSLGTTRIVDRSVNLRAKLQVCFRTVASIPEVLELLGLSAFHSKSV